MVDKDDDCKFDFYTEIGLTPLACYLSALNLNDGNIIYWKLRKMQVQRVAFDKNNWKDYYKPKILDFWEAVNNYEHSDEDDFRSDSD